MSLDAIIKKISPVLYRIGDLGVPVFLVDAPDPVIIDTGYSCTGELYAGAVKQILGKRKPRWCLITHSHFDHVGAAGYFKKLFPGMIVAGSELARKITCKQKTIEHIASLNLFAENNSCQNFSYAKTSFHPFQIEKVLAEGDVINLGNSLYISVLETPGHTRDSLCFFMEGHKILFTGDSGGIFHDGGYVFYDFLSGCLPYMDSLSKICGTGAEIICQGHYNVIKDASAHTYLKNLIPGCLSFINLASRVLNDHGDDIKTSMKIIKSLEYDHLDEPKQPEPAYLLNLEARLRSVFSYISS